MSFNDGFAVHFFMGYDAMYLKFELFFIFHD